MLLDRALQLGHDDLVVTERELSLHLQLHHAEAQLLQTSYFEPERLVVGEISERVATPERQGLPTEGLTTLRVRAELGGAEEQVLEPQGVDLIPPDHELVGVVGVLQRIVSDHMPEPGDVGLQRVVRRLRRRLAPQPRAQPVHRHGPTGAQHEHAQHGAAVTAPDRLYAGLGQQVDRSQHPDEIVVAHRYVQSSP